MLAALVSGATRSGLQLLANGEDPDALLAALGPLLERGVLEAGNGIAVYGAGHTAITISRILDEHGRRQPEAADAAPYPDAVVIVSHFVTPPATRSVWLRRDVPHLPVVFSDTGVLIGPLVLPGRGRLPDLRRTPPPRSGRLLAGARGATVRPGERHRLRHAQRGGGSDRHPHPRSGAARRRARLHGADRCRDR